MTPPTPEQLQALNEAMQKAIAIDLISPPKIKRNIAIQMCLFENREILMWCAGFTAKALGDDCSPETICAAVESYGQNGKFALVTHFKAMIQQIAKECAE